MQLIPNTTATHTITYTNTTDAHTVMYIPYNYYLRPIIDHDHMHDHFAIHTCTGNNILQLLLMKFCLGGVMKIKTRCTSPKPLDKLKISCDIMLSFDLAFRI